MGPNGRKVGRPVGSFSLTTRSIDQAVLHGQIIISWFESEAILS